MLVLKLKYGSKRKGKDGKWTTATEKTIVVAEQANFMRLLERSQTRRLKWSAFSKQAGKEGVLENRKVDLWWNGTACE